MGKNGGKMPPAGKRPVRAPGKKVPAMPPAKNPMKNPRQVPGGGAITWDQGNK